MKKKSKKNYGTQGWHPSHYCVEPLHSGGNDRFCLRVYFMKKTKYRLIPVLTLFYRPRYLKFNTEVETLFTRE
jgi:hypothetical protein